MVVGTTGHWKHPIAYVLQNKCSVDIQACLITDCIGLLHSWGINVLEVVFDGTFTNQQTALQLDCKMKVFNIQTWFPHPQCSSSKIYIIFYACHIIKLMWNLLGNYQTISHRLESKQIKGEYIDRLNHVQEELSFSLANKLTKKHIIWEKHKMNVKMAAQLWVPLLPLLLTSVVMVIEHPDFEDSESATSFIKRMDVAFDLLNSRNPIGKGSKQPVSSDYYPKWSIQCEKFADYIFDLRDGQGCLLRNGHCKTVIWGFTFTLRSVKAVTEELLTCTYISYKYVRTLIFSRSYRASLQQNQMLWWLEQ